MNFQLNIYHVIFDLEIGGFALKEKNAKVIAVLHLSIKCSMLVTALFNLVETSKDVTPQFSDCMVFTD